MEDHRLAHEVLDEGLATVGRLVGPAQQARIFEGNARLRVVSAILFVRFLPQLGLYGLGQTGRIARLQRVFDAGLKLPAVLLTVLLGGGHACVDARLLEHLILRHGEKSEQEGRHCDAEGQKTQAEEATAIDEQGRQKGLQTIAERHARRENEEPNGRYDTHRAAFAQLPTTDPERQQQQHE